jgi:hypothetical protein
MGMYYIIRCNILIYTITIYNITIYYIYICIMYTISVLLLLFLELLYYGQPTKGGRGVGFMLQYGVKLPHRN